MIEKGSHINNTGNSAATLSDERFEYSPVTGTTLVMVWRGDATAIQAKDEVYRSISATTSRANLNSHLYELTVRIDVDLANSVTETPVDTFRWSDEFLTKDNFSNPLTSNPNSYPNIEDDDFPGSGSPGSVNATQTATIETVVAKKQAGDKTFLTDWAALLDLNPWAADVAFFRMRGESSYEIKRPVLTRIRTYSTNYAQRQVIEAVPTVYSTGSLIAREQFPEVIQNQMPADPPSDVTPPATEWGWRIRAQESEVIPTQAKIQESTSWTFDAWPKPFYKFV